MYWSLGILKLLGFSGDSKGVRNVWRRDEIETARHTFPCRHFYVCRVRLSCTFLRSSFRRVLLPDFFLHHLTGSSKLQIQKSKCKFKNKSYFTISNLELGGYKNVECLLFGLKLIHPFINFNTLKNLLDVAM